MNVYINKEELMELLHKGRVRIHTFKERTFINLILAKKDEYGDLKKEIGGLNG